MTATLRLVSDCGGDTDCDPLVAWEIFMRGAGRSERTVREGILTMRRLERRAGRPCEELKTVDVSRFLSDAGLMPRSRAAYFGSISHRSTSGTEQTAVATSRPTSRTHGRRKECHDRSQQAPCTRYSRCE